jgi:hypothetical protein
MGAGANMKSPGDNVKRRNFRVVSELGGAGRAATRRASQREARHLEIRSLPLAEVAWYGLCQNAIILDLTNFRHVPFCLFHAETEFLIHGGAKIQFS